MKIVILDGYTENPGDLSWEGFQALGNVTVYDRTPENLIATRIGDAQAVITNKAPITRSTLEQCRNLRYVGVLATGYNIVDVQACRQFGVTVCNVPTYGTAAVAQYVFALLLEICHHVGHHDATVHAGKWNACSDWCYWDYPLIELAGKTMGFIGYGRIGRAAAEIARAFGMKVLAYDPGLEQGVWPEAVELNELLASSDIISLHCPLLPSTEGIICKKNIKRMKEGAILINTARGPLVNETDLCAALHSGKLAYAALDVVSKEPVAKDNPLLTAPHCILTPHIAWAPKESRSRLMDIAVENLRMFCAGTPVNQV